MHTIIYHKRKLQRRFEVPTVTVLMQTDVIMSICQNYINLCNYVDLSGLHNYTQKSVEYVLTCQNYNNYCNNDKSTKLQ